MTATTIPRIAAFLAAIAFLLGRASPCFAAQFYLAPSGDDGNPGTRAAPWATLAHAADMAQAGDTVTLRGGTYTVGLEAEFNRTGTAEAPITVAAAEGERPILDAQGATGGILTVKQGVSYIRISGLTLRGFNVWGLTLEGSNRSIRLDHLNIGGGEAAVRMTVGYSGEEPAYGAVEEVVLEDSAFHDSAFTVVDCTPGPCNQATFRRLDISGGGLGSGPSFGADGIGLERGAPVLVEDCSIHDNGGDGLDLNSRDVEGNLTGVLVRRNRVFRNHLMGIKLWSGGRMENNLVWGQGVTPVFLGRFPGRFEVVNNTVAFNMVDPEFAERDYALVAAYPLDGPSASITLTLQNNIFAFNTGMEIGDGPTGIYLGAGVTLSEGRNLYFSREDAEIQADFVTGREPTFSRAEILDGTWTRTTGQGEGDLVLDPLFNAGYPLLDARLRPESPAVDAGAAEGAPRDDLDRLPRDARPDLGAYEMRQAPPHRPRLHLRRR